MPVAVVKPLVAVTRPAADTAPATVALPPTLKSLDAVTAPVNVLAPPTDAVDATFNADSDDTPTTSRVPPR